MGAVQVKGLGKAYRIYPSHWSRFIEWASPFAKKKHDLRWILKELDFSIAAGESVGIMGINGAGKSTLLKLIAGTTQPTCGDLKIQGSVSALLELGMGFHPDFTGRQNVYMAGQLLGLSGARISSLMAEIEAFAEIGDYIDQPVRVYSSGMQIRLAFSVATAVRPDILIVDEALAVGDAYFQAKCYDRITRFKELGTTLLLVSHSVADITKHCSRALLLQSGRLVLDGSSREVTNHYLDALFGKPAAAESQQTAQVDNAIATTSTQDLFHTHPGYRKEEHRWGQGGAVILDYFIDSEGQSYPSHINSGQQVNFYFKVQFVQSYESVVPGFLIKTLEGVFLYGTNSFISTNGSRPITVDSGDVHVFRFSMALTLNEGFYLVSFGISSGDPLGTLVPLERRYDSVLIKVAKSVPFWGIADLNATFDLTESTF